jgi:1-deoxy-D-xylulose-5-phosphate reductoisomerase
LALNQKLALLGSTGSIGRQTLDVVSRFRDRFEIVALAAGNNHELLKQQIAQFQPRFVSCECDIDREAFPAVEFGSGVDGLETAATLPEVDMVVVATSGHAAILPTLRAIEQGKTIALANKEVIVCAGEVIIPAARRHNVDIRPVDSEHSAIWQCLHGPTISSDVARISLTASGGPFLTVPLEDLASVTVGEALNHPNWNMGSKITIDSATMMNKGLEIIEAHWLFDAPYAQIDVVIHPQSIVHSLVSFCDGSVLAQLGVHDMRVPIQHALTYPERLPAPQHMLNITELGVLKFQTPDLARFPALKLARQAGESGGAYPTVLSGADEVAASAFLSGQLRFPQIAVVVEEVLNRHQRDDSEIDLDRIAEIDEWTRTETRKVIEHVSR